MDFGWEPGQELLHRRLRSFADRALGDGLAGRERDQAPSTADWKACAEQGVLGLPIPEQHGGGGHDPVTCAYALEGLGYGCLDNGLLLSMGAHVWAVEVPIWRFGTHEQKERLLPRLCSGELVGAHAISEPGAGSDALSLQTEARRDGPHYVLNGRKAFVTNGPVADLFLVYATINPKLGFTGVTAFLVERGQPGLSVRAGDEKMGLRTATWADVTLADCRVDARQRLGAEKQGRHVFASVMAWERSLILAPLLGAMQRQIDACIDHARRRRQFGQRIGAFQGVAHTVADMQVRLESARLLTYKAAWQLAHDESSVLAEMAKLQTSEAAVQTFLDAIQLHGAVGYTVGAQIERGLRDAVGLSISSGTSQLQRSVIAGKLGLHQPPPSGRRAL